MNKKLESLFSGGIHPWEVGYSFGDGYTLKVTANVIDGDTSECITLIRDDKENQPLEMNLGDLKELCVIVGHILV